MCISKELNQPLRILFDSRLLLSRHTAVRSLPVGLHAVGASVPEGFRLTRRFAAEARQACRVSKLMAAKFLDSR
jgi:hypothetical protein